MFKIGIKGKLLNSDYKDWYIMIQPRAGVANSPYLVLLVNNLSAFDDPKLGLGYDDWVENYDQLIKYMASKNWHIEWLD